MTQEESIDFYKNVMKKQNSIIGHLTVPVYPFFLIWIVFGNKLSTRAHTDQWKIRFLHVGRDFELIFIKPWNQESEFSKEPLEPLIKLKIEALKTSIQVRIDISYSKKSFEF